MKKREYQPSREVFREKAVPGSVVPVFKDILADTDTPVSAFMKIDAGADAFLLESVEGGEKWGRYSFLGVAPKTTIAGKGKAVELRDSRGVRKIEGDPVEVLKELLSAWKPAEVDGAPRFTGGAIGYIGYDSVRLIERLPDTAPDNLGVFDTFFMLTDTFLVFDNVEHRVKVTANAFITEDTDVDRAYDEAVSKIDALVGSLKNGVVRNSPEAGQEPVSFSSNFTKQGFMDAVEKVKGYIVEGDIMQAVISQRFSAPLKVDPFDIYRALRVVNPSPYMFFLRLSGLTLVGSSPEILVRVEGDEVAVKPIAGTRKRGRNDEEDEGLSKELLADPKERAEHIMLVDLGRNDIGRVCKSSTVEVDDFMSVERYSHVMHIVSNVKGRLRDDADSFDALRASFPAGTLTGAPKVRAMEIIEELEPCKRGVYGGSIGYFSYSGGMDMCIAIRTLVIKDKTIYVQAGAGIVADSVPEKEFEETENKAKGMLKAINMAIEGLS